MSEDKAEQAMGHFLAEQIWEQSIETLLDLDDERLLGLLAGLKLRVDDAVREQFKKGPDGRLMRRAGAREFAHTRISRKSGPG